MLIKQVAVLGAGVMGAQIAENNIDTLLTLIRQHPLASVIHHNGQEITADHIPLLHEKTGLNFGKLIGHVAKNNPLWKTPSTQELMVIFQGPSHYISPNWYASKQQTGKGVPTWNYAVVHAYCQLNAIHDQQQTLDILNKLSHEHEKTQPHPWKLSEAPSGYIEQMAKQIICIELTILRIHGKSKASQNQPIQNQHTVVQGLAAENTDAAKQMTKLIQKNTNN